jgi:UMF1 family MFS transporter
MSPAPKPTGSIWRREIFAWCSYDWANSGYTTLMITVFAVYMQRTVFSPETSGSTGAVVWAWTVAVSMLIGAVLSPVLGALADARAAKRLGLAITAVGGGGACMAMALMPPESSWTVTAFFLMANLCLELSLTFYNGFLPEIANEEELNRVSAAGMGWGYLGGGLGLLLAMLLLNYGQAWGLGNGTQLLRICIFLTGVWWIVFTIPSIVILRDQPRVKLKTGVFESGRAALTEVIGTLRNLRMHRTLAVFLIGFLFYNDGLQTVISQCSTFALQELDFADRELVAVILMVQFVAMPGAIFIGVVSDRLGRKRTLEICLIVWILLLISAWFIHSKIAFWLMAIGVAFVLGGTQAVSRAIMGSLTPKHQEARFFGFFNMSGKATSFMGTFVFGLIVALTGSSRLAIVLLLVFFVVGLAIISRIDLIQGTKEREAAESMAQTNT